ncbi:hypothetical protein AX17_007083 [Amanita inopinata Kibby_2008]|nr:hypothetical protein AX17_007083 [Amanita inopinata Kibby_2008]
MATPFISAVTPSIIPPQLQGLSQDQLYWQQQQLQYQHTSPYGFLPQRQWGPQGFGGPGLFPSRPPTRSFFRRVFEYSPRARLFSPYGPGSLQFGSSLPPSWSASSFDFGPIPTSAQPPRFGGASIGQPPVTSMGFNAIPPTRTWQTGPPGALPPGPPPNAPLPNIGQNLGPPGVAFPGLPMPITKKEKSRLRVFGTIPRFSYLATLLFLPFFYRSRVHQIFKSVSLTENEIATLFASGVAPYEPAKLKHFEQVKRSWNEFIDSLYKEWNTLNIVSVLLLTAIYNVLQLGGTGSALVQCTALMSIISALMSLTYGCLYIIRFETMRRPYKAMQWAWDALNTSRSVWWNVFILLALPSVWLAWSLVLFLTCIMAVVWQTSGSTTNLRGLGLLPLSVQVAVSAFLFVGLVYLGLVVFTFSRYDDVLDRSWAQRLKNIVNNGLANAHFDQYPNFPWETQQIASPPGAPIIPPAAPILPPSALPPGFMPGPRLPSIFGVNPASRPASISSQRRPSESFTTTNANAYYAESVPPGPPLFDSYVPMGPFIPPLPPSPPFPHLMPPIIPLPMSAPIPLAPIVEESSSPPSSSESSSTDTLTAPSGRRRPSLSTSPWIRLPPPHELVPPPRRNANRRRAPIHPRARRPSERARSTDRTRRSPPSDVVVRSPSLRSPAADDSPGGRGSDRTLPPLPVSDGRSSLSQSGSPSPSLMLIIEPPSRPLTPSYDSSRDGWEYLSPDRSPVPLPLPEIPVSPDDTRSQSLPTLLLVQQDPSQDFQPEIPPGSLLFSQDSQDEMSSPESDDEGMETARSEWEDDGTGNNVQNV